MQDINALRAAFEQYRAAHAFTREPAGLYGPVEYIMSSPGKRLRPLLVLLGASLYGENWRQSLPVAMAVEVFHNFSLIHDDIMDEAPLRRGKPAVHSKFGLNAGILSGDVMLIQAYRFLAEGGYGDAKVAQLFRIFNQVAIEVCEGQQYDVDFESRHDVTIPEYIRMIELKTAALIGGSLEMGGLAGGAPAADLEQLRQFGRNIGIAFQLQDDMLDAFGDAAQVGKRVGGDIAQNKKTFLILEAMQRAEGADLEALRVLMSTTPANENEKIQTVIGLLHQLGIPAWAEQQKQHYQDTAFEALKALQAPETGKTALRQLAEALLNRQS